VYVFWYPGDGAEYGVQKPRTAYSLVEKVEAERDTKLRELEDQFEEFKNKLSAAQERERGSDDEGIPSTHSAHATHAAAVPLKMTVSESSVLVDLQQLTQVCARAQRCSLIGVSAACFMRWRAARRRGMTRELKCIDAATSLRANCRIMPLIWWMRTVLQYVCSWIRSQKSLISCSGGACS
jgi:hypothetical protein